MGLADYIEENAHAILDAAESFATKQLPDGVHLDREALRDHLPQILEVVVADLRRNQTGEDELAKAEGHRDTAPGTASAAQLHGRLRAKAGFNVDQLVAEYRALRASVLRMWAKTEPVGALPFEDMIRFNQAVDQAVAESVAHFSAEAEAWRHVFLGVLGHDLRGPLTAIMLTSDLMSKMTIDTPLSRHTERLIVSGKRMNVLLDDLLDFSRTSLGMGIRITRRDTDLTAELADEIEMLRAAWPGILIEFDTFNPVKGNFDASRLREAVTNLINNAAKYGAASGKVRLTLENDDDMVLLRVHNTGLAIPSGTMASMFEPLHRGSEGDERDESSSLGLGLFVVREIAKAHGGDIQVESSNGDTVFTMRLLRERQSTKQH